MSSESRLSQFSALKSVMTPVDIRNKMGITIGQYGNLNRQYRKKLANKDEAVVFQEYQEPEIESRWTDAEKRASKIVDKFINVGKVSVDMPDNPVSVVFLSDQHISLNGVDLRQMRLDAEYIRDTDGVYCMLVGDMIDNAIKHRGSVVNSKTSPDEEWDLLCHYLDILGPKVILATSGNHDNWSKDFAGVDVLKRIANNKNIVYVQHEANVTVSVGPVDYRVMLRHQTRYNSAMNQTHGIKQMLRYGGWNFDIGVSGHTHSPVIESFEWGGEIKHAMKPGSYQIATSFSDQYGFPRSKPSMPAVVLSNKEKSVIPVMDFRLATHIAKSLNEIAPKK